MRTEGPIVAILTADIHLSLNAPVCRQAEPDWFAAMKRPLNEIRDLRDTYKVPIICAGDIFDRWNSPPKLINFALDWLPPLCAVPGQHDLPMHRYDLMGDSAYGTLEAVGKIDNLDPGELELDYGALCVQGFPWGTPLEPCDIDERVGPRLRVAVVHSFAWMNKETGYPGAPEQGTMSAMKKQMEGWDVVVFGDNHKGFLTICGGTTVFNCGTVLRRRADEVDYRPHVGLLYRSGEVDIHYLDISQDVLEVVEGSEWRPEKGLTEFVGALKALSGDPLDFTAAMEKVMRECDPGVRSVLVEVLNE